MKEVNLLAWTSRYVAEKSAAERALSRGEGQVSPSVGRCKSAHSQQDAVAPNTLASSAIRP
jgi:hypothetical protein